MLALSNLRLDLTLYLMGGFHAHAGLLKQLGKFTTSKGWLYIKQLDDVDKKVLREPVQGIGQANETTGSEFWGIIHCKNKALAKGIMRRAGDMINCWVPVYDQGVHKHGNWSR